MPANNTMERTDLIDDAVERIREMIPQSWKVERSNRADLDGDGRPPSTPTDGAITLQDARGTLVTLAVQAKQSFEPRAVGQLSAGLSGVIRSIAGYIPILVVAPWISPRARELLASEDINYVDLTGNALVKLENPPLYIRAAGAPRNPQPTPRGHARVRGPKAARLIRLLVDVCPPYGVSEIAAATGLAQGYVSRLLDALDRDALVERSRRGRVEDADFAGLLRRWAESYDVLKANDAFTYLTPRGARDTLSRLADLPTSMSVAVTGSFAAVRVAPVAVPALLIAYSNEIQTVANELGLLPRRRGGQCRTAASVRPRCLGENE
jgi:hypothetical protein